LAPWLHQSRLIGFCRAVDSPKNIWLMLHGNGGQAADRVYALPAFSNRDSVFILEYPGYGSREGSPSMPSFNAAAKEAYEALRAQYPNTPVCVVGESIGSGPACALAGSARPPDKLVLIVPFDTLANVASDHYPFLPAKLILRDNWNNLSALRHYEGPLEIYGARDDQVIPISHAKALAESRTNAVFHEIDGGHNDWSRDARVMIRNP